jgi:chemotaxis protein MotB
MVRPDQNKLSAYPHDPNRWIVSYADFTTMLLALFIVLYAVSQLDIAQMRDFTTSLKKSFASIELTHKEKRSELNKLFATTQSVIKAKPVTFSFQEQIAALKKKLEEASQEVPASMNELDKVKNLLKEKLPAQDQINMIHSERGLIISLADTVLFDTGSAEIKNQALPTLNEIATILRTLPNPIRVEGHTDDRPINTPRYPSNWELSTDRATSIVKYFIEKFNFAPSKLSAAGYGKYRPVASNTTTEGRQANRRVDIVILNSGSEIFEPDVKLQVEQPSGE